MLAQPRFAADLAVGPRQAVRPLDVLEVAPFQHRARTLGDVAQHGLEPGSTRHPLPSRQRVEHAQGRRPTRLAHVGKQSHGVVVGGRSGGDVDRGLLDPDSRRPGVPLHPLGQPRAAPDRDSPALASRCGRGRWRSRWAGGRGSAARPGRRPLSAPRGPPTRPARDGGRPPRLAGARSADRCGRGRPRGAHVPTRGAGAPVRSRRAAHRWASTWRREMTPAWSRSRRAISSTPSTVMRHGPTRHARPRACGERRRSWIRRTRCVGSPT